MSVLALPPAIAGTVPLPDGETLLVPAACEDIIDAALLQALHERGLILVPRARSSSRQSVDADIYSLALSMKGAAERRLAEAARLVGPCSDPDAGDLVAEFADLIAALTGHAPPAGAVRCAHVYERLCSLHEMLLGRPSPVAQREGEKE